jgi:hypothetical protein
VGRPSSDRRFPATLLEIVARPERPVIQIATWLRLLEEFASIKNSVIHLKPKVAIRLPVNLRPGPVPNEPGSTPICSSDQESRHGVDAIFETLAPLEDPIERRGHIMLLKEDEDWSFLRDRSLRQDFWDPIKYIPLRGDAGDWYLTIGGEVREVWEQIGNDNWGERHVHPVVTLL